MESTDWVVFGLTILNTVILIILLGILYTIRPMGLGEAVQRLLSGPKQQPATKA